MEVRRYDMRCTIALYSVVAKRATHVHWDGRYFYFEWPAWVLAMQLSRLRSVNL